MFFLHYILVHFEHCAVSRVKITNTATSAFDIQGTITTLSVCINRAAWLCPLFSAPLYIRYYFYSSLLFVQFFLFIILKSTVCDVELLQTSHNVTVLRLNTAHGNVYMLTLSSVLRFCGDRDISRFWCLRYRFRYYFAARTSCMLYLVAFISRMLSTVQGTEKLPMCLAVLLSRTRFHGQVQEQGFVK